MSQRIVEQVANHDPEIVEVSVQGSGVRL
jgi:hypothetical protein